jgi:hypothetical protein
MAFRDVDGLGISPGYSVDSPGDSEWTARNGNLDGTL